MPLCLRDQWHPYHGRRWSGAATGCRSPCRASAAPPSEFSNADGSTSSLRDAGCALRVHTKDHNREKWPPTMARRERAATVVSKLDTMQGRRRVPKSRVFPSTATSKTKQKTIRVPRPPFRGTLNLLGFCRSWGFNSKRKCRTRTPNARRRNGRNRPMEVKSTQVPPSPALRTNSMASCSRASSAASCRRCARSASRRSAWISCILFSRLMPPRPESEPPEIAPPSSTLDEASTL